MVAADYSPFLGIEKGAVLQEARVFNDPQLDPRRCSQVFSLHGQPLYLHIFKFLLGGSGNDSEGFWLVRFSGYNKAFVPAQSGGDIHKGPVFSFYSCFLIFTPLKSVLLLHVSNLAYLSFQGLFLAVKCLD